jgi:hypothetical protein
VSGEARLAAGFEASALIRRAEGAGGFGAVLHKGDAERGALLLVVAERGAHSAFVERRLSVGGVYVWARCGPESGDSAAADQYVVRRAATDPDCWIIELNVPSAERFIAETIADG